MNEQVYLNELKDKLSSLEPPMIEAIINQYKQIFDAGHNDNKDDAHIIEEIGSTDFVSNYYITTLAARRESNSNKTSVNSDEGTVIVDSRGVQTGSFTDTQNIHSSTSTNIFRGILVGFGLFFFNLVVVLGPYLGIWGVIFGFLVSGIAISFSGIAVAIVGFLPVNHYATIPFILVEHPVLLISTAIILVCIGMILILLMLFFGKHLSSLTLKYLQWNFKVIRGE